MDTLLHDGFVLVSHDDCSDMPERGLSQAAPKHLEDINEVVDAIGQKFWPVNQRIHDHPEVAFKEFIAHDALTSFVRSYPGWEVTPSAYGMKTSWVAVFDSGRPGPVVSFNAEMDALPGIGHACGHNLIASASVVAAVASSEMMTRHELPGKIVLFGTPAEEGGGGKIRLLDAGAYSEHGVDVSLISHPGITANTALMRTTACSDFKVEYFGRAAHAAARPWLGINALDALITAYTNVSVLRQQTMHEDIIQGYITDGGASPGVIHAYAAGIFGVRANTQARLDELKKKVVACFEAGALATGAKLIITTKDEYKDHVPNRVLGRSYRRYFNALDPPSRIPDGEDDKSMGRTQSSTDQGDISHAMPSLNVGFVIPPGPGGQGPHNPEFAVSAGTRVAYDRALRVAKGLTGVAWDVLTRAGLLHDVKRQWKKDMGLE